MAADGNDMKDSHEIDDVVEEEPESKRGTEGQAANEGARAGPNSDQAGKAQAPQTGNPRADDRRPS